MIFEDGLFYWIIGMVLAWNNVKAFTYGALMMEIMWARIGTIVRAREKDGAAYLCGSIPRETKLNEWL